VRGGLSCGVAAMKHDRARSLVLRRNCDGVRAAIAGYR
jgi:hypothetical protein